MHEEALKVFVYGTLKVGKSNHCLLDSSTFLEGTFRTKPEYTMLNLGNYPGVLHRGDTAILGEVYRVTGDILKDLDLLEGCPNFYMRNTIATTWGHAWIYLLSPKYIDSCIGSLNSINIIKEGVW